MALARLEGGTPSYDERLFSKGLRARLHFARFQWAQRISQRVPHDSVLELGCFDGRLLDYINPRYYVGVDAGWEGGVDKAIAQFASDGTRRFIKTDRPGDLADLPSGSFELGVALETLEHLPEHLLDRYLAEAARLCDYFLVTVPNEKGPIFLGKWLIKRILQRDADAATYSPYEVLNATLGRMHLVRRHEHKGFDFVSLISRLSERFNIQTVAGIPFGPPSLSFTVGILARSRRSRMV